MITSGEGTERKDMREMLFLFILCFIIFATFKKHCIGNPLVVQWLVLHTHTAEGLGLIPYGGTKTPQAKWYGKKIHKQTNKNHCTYINLIEMKENAITIRTVVGTL